MLEKTGRVELGQTRTESGGISVDVDRHGEPVASRKEKEASDASTTQDLLEQKLRNDLD
jgi:hypothetical protein